VRCAPGFPCALLFRAIDSDTNSGISRRGKADLYLEVIGADGSRERAPDDGLRDEAIDSLPPRLMDSFALLAMTIAVQPL
jgi:hypothetical protein